MKKTVLIIFSITLTVITMAQDSWKVYCGNKQLLKTATSDESKNIIRLGGENFGDKDAFIIHYSEKSPQKDWKRIIAVFDAKDNELKQVEGASSFNIPMPALVSLLKEKGTLKFYTWALPNDPELAARIRIRRIYLCTVEMK
ncbi:MAG: hypothetical protein GC171_03475 [Terrimonas sp.]|nr:hypothetical protein [Terrimonas sp.]